MIRWSSWQVWPWHGWWICSYQSMCATPGADSFFFDPPKWCVFCVFLIGQDMSFSTTRFNKNGCDLLFSCGSSGNKTTKLTTKVPGWWPTKFQVFFVFFLFFGGEYVSWPLLLEWISPGSSFFLGGGGGGNFLRERRRRMKRFRSHRLHQGDTCWEPLQDGPKCYVVEM